MVVTAPVTVPTARIQERVAIPSTCTVHAPHCAMPQPNLVPVSPMISRSTQRRGISGGTSTVYDFPLTVSDTAIGVPSSVAPITDMDVAEQRLCMPQNLHHQGSTITESPGSLSRNFVRGCFTGVEA